MAPAKAPARDLAAEVAFLTRALKAPTLRESAPRLAEPMWSGDIAERFRMCDVAPRREPTGSG